MSATVSTENLLSEYLLTVTKLVNVKCCYSLGSTKL